MRRAGPPRPQSCSTSLSGASLQGSSTLWLVAPCSSSRRARPSTHQARAQGGGGVGGQPPEDLLAKLSTLQNQIASIKSRNEALRAQLKDVAVKKQGGSPAAAGAAAEPASDGAPTAAAPQPTAAAAADAADAADATPSPPVWDAPPQAPQRAADVPEGTPAFWNPSNRYMGVGPAVSASGSAPASAQAAMAPQDSNNVLVNSGFTSHGALMVSALSGVPSPVSAAPAKPPPAAAAAAAAAPQPPAAAPAATAAVAPASQPPKAEAGASAGAPQSALAPEEEAKTEEVEEEGKKKEEEEEEERALWPSSSAAWSDLDGDSVVYAVADLQGASALDAAAGDAREAGGRAGGDAGAAGGGGDGDDALWQAGGAGGAWGDEEEGESPEIWEGAMGWAAPGAGGEEEVVFDDWESMDIVFVSAEVAPWSKTGGLGDVVGSLPKALAARGHRVMVVAPRYYNDETKERYASVVDTGMRKGIDLWDKGGYHEVGYHHVHEDQVDWVFVDHISFHRPGNPYGNAHGVYADNLFRFSLLSMAAIEATLVLNVGGYRYEGVPGEPYGQRCLFVANDWHASLLPLYLGARFRPHDVHKESRCVLALHNLAHQGSYPPTMFPSLGLPGDWYGAMEWVVNVAPTNPKGSTVAIKTINCLKAALVTSDKIVAVSQNYASEICDEQGQGCGLASLLSQRQDALRGIVNGVDCGEWDPATDVHLDAHYDIPTLEDKAICKAALQVELRLPVETDRPLLAFVGRLDYQKGPDLVLQALEYLINLDAQVVILGSGAADYEAAVKKAQQDYPYFVRGITKFDVPLSHRIIAGADILLMPSRFEPCGLNQLYAMRYGTVPVAHSTGGLRDTIADYNTFAPPGSRDRGTGWTFSPATLDAFVDACSEAVRVYTEQPDEWRRLMVRGMQQDFSWGRAARQYETVFLEVMREEQETREAREAKGAAAMARQQELLKRQAEEADRLAKIKAAQEAAAAAIRAANAKALDEKEKKLEAERLKQAKAGVAAAGAAEAQGKPELVGAAAGAGSSGSSSAGSSATSSSST